MQQTSIDIENAVYNHALSLLQQMLGVNAEFRPGQREAIESVALRKRRVMLVQRTGWGKSIVYFLATKLLRELGWLTTSWRRQGMLRDLLLKLYDRQAGITCDGPARRLRVSRELRNGRTLCSLRTLGRRFE
jgi:hypothetical protein